jgi:hypothetical protein
MGRAGATAGALNLIATAIAPLADDTGGRVATWIVPLLLLWTVLSVAAGRRSGRFRDAVVAGMVLGLCTMALFNLAAIVRVNVFLEEIRYRDDWHNLLARFQASGVHSLRSFANYEYFTGTPLVLALGALAGAVSGIVGGAAGAAFRPKRAAKH